MSRRALRRRHPLAWIVLGTAALVTLDVGAWVAWALVHLVVTLAPALVLAATAVAGWRWWRRRGSARAHVMSSSPGRVVQGEVLSEAGQLRTERDDLRRQVAKLEADAARHDALIGDLEDAAGRPADAIIATYRHVQRQYGEAAVGKTGGAQ